MNLSFLLKLKEPFCAFTNTQRVQELLMVLRIHFEVLAYVELADPCLAGDQLPTSRVDTTLEE